MFNQISFWHNRFSYFVLIQKKITLRYLKSSPNVCISILYTQYNFKNIMWKLLNCIVKNVNHFLCYLFILPKLNSKIYLTRKY